MFRIDESKWKIHDPDGILSYHFESFDVSDLKFGGVIHPREDMLSFTHKETSYIVDFGYYGCEVTMDGRFVVYVIDANLEDGWSNPIERHEENDFLEAILNLKAMYRKYS